MSLMASGSQDHPVIFATAVLGGMILLGALLLIGGAHLGTGPQNMIGYPLGIRADGGDLKIALGDTCPAGVTYTVRFDQYSPTAGSQYETMVFTDSQPLTVFDPFHLPASATIVTPFPAGFQWQDANGIAISVQYPDGTKGNDTGAGLSYTDGSADQPPGTYNFGPQWMTVDQAMANPDWRWACSPK